MDIHASEFGAAGVPLKHYIEHEAAMRLTCMDCLLNRMFDVAAVIARLERRGVGGPLTGIRGVARWVCEPCPRCGGRRFDSGPVFRPDPTAVIGETPRLQPA